jgi:hypothetical protein
MEISKKRNFSLMFQSKKIIKVQATPAPNRINILQGNNGNGTRRRA